MDLQFIKKEEPVEYVLVATQQGQIVHQQISNLSNGLVKELLDEHIKQESNYMWSDNEVEASEAQLSAHSDEMEVPKLNADHSTNLSKSKKEKSNLKAESYSRIRLRNYECDKCEATFIYKSAFLNHTARHEQSNIDQCKICKMFFPKSIIEFHTESHNGPPFTCKICFKTFLIKRSWNHHRFIHQNNNLIECDICGKRVKSKYSMLGHLKVHRERTKDFHCKLCQSSFFRIQAFNRHIKRRHGSLVYTCSNTLCSRVFLEKSSLDAHKCRNMNPANVAKELTNQNKHPCDKCKKIFHNIHRLILHVAQNCSKKITYQCDYCSKTFSEKSSLIPHFGSLHKFRELKRRTCYQCRRTFTCKGVLKKHLKNVHCNQTFSQPTGLKIHSKEYVSHGSNKKYAKNHNESMGQNFENFSCDICDYIFVQKAYIVEHMLLVHSKNGLQTKKGYSDRLGIDKFSCSICNKSFQKQYLLQRHTRRMHTVAGKYFVCDICNKNFLSEKLYVKHIEALICRNRIQCAICSKIFAYKSGLVRHWSQCSKIHDILTNS